MTAIAQKSGLTKNQAKDALEAFVDCVTVSLKDGSEVCIVGSGQLPRPPGRAAGLARNPRTGEQVKRDLPPGRPGSAPGRG